MPGSGKNTIHLFAGEDKLVHGGLFTVWITLLYSLVIVSQKNQYSITSLLIVLLLGIGTGIGTEWLQSYIPYRTMDTNDFIADLLGTIAAIITVLSIKKRLILVDNKYE